MADAQVFTSTLGFLTASLKLTCRQQPLVDARRATAVVAAAKQPGALGHFVFASKLALRRPAHIDQLLTYVITQLLQPHSFSWCREDALAAFSAAILVSLWYAIQPIRRVSIISG